jgi:hypothetical protein
LSGIFAADTSSFQGRLHESEDMREKKHFDKAQKHPRPSNLVLIEAKPMANTTKPWCILKKPPE